MKVETYLTNIGNNEASELANSFEYVERLEKLGLTKQKTLVNPNSVEVFNFKTATKEELEVYKTLFEEKCFIEEYENELIPLEVLDVYEKALRSGKFNRVEVWYKPIAEIKDPLLVAVEVKKTTCTWDPKGYYTSDVFYFLARWGEELLSFAELKVLAVKKLIDKQKNRFQDAIDQAESKMKQLNRLTVGDLADMDIVALSSIY